jgi:hypothetical protein
MHSQAKTQGEMNCPVIWRREDTPLEHRMAGYDAGRRYALYRWPRIEVKTHSSLISWHNLDVGLGYGPESRWDAGWWPDLEAYERVLQGHKPMSMNLHFDSAYLPHLQNMLRAAGADRFSVTFEVGESHLLRGPVLYVNIARAVTYGYLFDLSMIAADYSAAGFTDIGSSLLGLADLPIFDRGDSLSNRDASDPACGLALGYPIETNLARLTHDLYEADPE